MIRPDAVGTLQRRATPRARTAAPAPATIAAPTAHASPPGIVREPTMSPTDAGTGTPPARAGSLRMRIERITFENIDVPSHQQARLHGAIEQELARLWRMRERAPEAGERERVRGGGLRVGGAIDVDAMAAEIARSVHASLDAGQGAGA